jgi:hypothetical protein
MPLIFEKMTGQHASAALRWFDSMRAHSEWVLKTEEQCELLGGVKLRTFQHWTLRALQGEPVDLPRDTLERFSVLLGIYKGLKMLAPTERRDVALRWFYTPNSAMPFNGQSPKQYAIDEKTVDALYSIRRYLDSAYFPA